MSLPTPDAMRLQIAETERLRIASWEDEHVRITKLLEKVSEHTYKLNDDGKLCAAHYFNSSVHGPTFAAWLQQRFTRDNSAWNISVVCDPHRCSDYKLYAITMVER